ncbi:GlxA family transcriptional regulator [Cupriavidus plantarum]|uniref:GlxA family transcriptional regulator n=1 Tax=Cupriavidus plantarum TaxID=942865 RepID=UPI001B1914C5|nr:helix-turn-helix domain-containing protein [Cupriavidus plantarum]CAG2128946.1 HTH-type transcriptional regulator CdhR [Cupriavidus plantarum]SMR66391.1 transcriptional regulator, AraC family with amidase-like domain [Cupriavidus plantarum]
MTTHAQPARERPPSAARRVVILGLPPVDALDVIGPAEVFANANRMHAGKRPPYVLELVTASPGTQIESETGIALVGHRTLAQERRAARPIDTLIVTTGFSAIGNADPAAIAWLQKRAASVRRMCAICVGAFPLAEAGLLDGRRATTHWQAASYLAERYPSVTVDPAPIWIRDGNVYTSAGVSAGIDLALALVAEDLGDEVALAIARGLVLYLRRPGGQAQFSTTLRAQHTPGSALERLCRWIAENLDADLSVEALASHAAMSVRTLIRAFQRELDTTPARYVEEVRIEAVRRALEMGGRTVEDIARRHGYQSIDVLRKAFIRRVGVSPKDYLKQFTPERGAA